MIFLSRLLKLEFLHGRVDLDQLWFTSGLLSVRGNLRVNSSLQMESQIYMVLIVDLKRIIQVYLGRFYEIL